MDLYGLVACIPVFTESPFSTSAGRPLSCTWMRYNVCTTTNVTGSGDRRSTSRYVCCSSWTHARRCACSARSTTRARWRCATRRASTWRPSAPRPCSRPAPPRSPGTSSSRSRTRCRRLPSSRRSMRNTSLLNKVRICDRRLNYRVNQPHGCGVLAYCRHFFYRHMHSHTSIKRFFSSFSSILLNRLRRFVVNIDQI